MENIILTELIMMYTFFIDFYNINEIIQKAIITTREDNSNSLLEAYVSESFANYIIETLSVVKPDYINYDNSFILDEYKFNYDNIPIYIDNNIPFGDIKFQSYILEYL